MSHTISLDDAITMTKSFRKNREEILHQNYKGKNTLAYSETFSVDAILTLVANPLCRKMRIYYGMDEDQKVHAILVGVDANDNDILPANTTEPTSMIVEIGIRCPTNCPTAESPLNT